MAGRSRLQSATRVQSRKNKSIVQQTKLSMVKNQENVNLKHHFVFLSNKL